MDKIRPPAAVNPLLATKLYIPPARPGRVQRTRLVERMNAAVNHPVTLVCAPTGYGKTSLLSEWIPQNEHCVTWLAVDEGDNDPVRFWRHFLAALQTLNPDLCRNAQQQLEATQNPQIEAVLTLAINDLAALSYEFSHVCDDYHLINNLAIDQSMIFLVEHLPPNVHLVLTSRRDPALPLARWRAHRQLAEIRSPELRFTAKEAAAFFNNLMRLDLSETEIKALETRTEGWIAGMQLAALSIKDVDDRAGFITAFAGSHRYIIDYLAEEVLAQQTEVVRNFLLSTSLLERLCGPLCNVLTGRGDSQAILEHLEQANLFIVPLDDERHWYRYHQLFADVLQARLRQQHPGMLAEYHQRAGNWFLQQGQPAEAVRHALAGENFEQAADLIETVAGKLLRQGASVSLIRWLDAMPQELILSRPRLCLARAWTYHWGPELNVESADEWANLALQVAQQSGALAADVTGEAYAVFTLTAATRSEVARSLELSRQALDNLSFDSPWRGLMALCLGTASLDAGDMTGAAIALDEALELSIATGAIYIQLVAASFLAEIDVFQGHLNRAAEKYQQVLDWANPELPQKGDVMAHGGLAGIFYEQNQLDTALAHIQLGLANAARVGGAWSAHMLYRVLARIHLARGNWQEALATLELSYHQGVQRKVRLVETHAATQRACLLLARGDLAAAEHWMVTSGLTPDDPEASHPGWREIEYLALARILAAQGKTSQALSLLERLFLAAQVEQRAGSMITVLILQSLLLHTLGQTPQAHQYLERALELAEPEGFMRVFIDEGEMMRVLLIDLRKTMDKRLRTQTNHASQRLRVYLLKILTGFLVTQVPVPVAAEALAEPLSQRELEVLHLIGAGLSNQQIADELVVAVSTVKSHINHLYGKLGAHSRVQAVSVARDLHLLAD